MNPDGKKEHLILAVLGFWVLAVFPAWAEAPGRVLIPGGEFTLGSGTGPPHGPAHRVRLDAFLMATHEVTNAEYERFLPDHRRSVQSACDTCPATGMAWHQADSFCRQQGGRLPTEAEWEHAARGPEGDAYVFEPEAARGHFARDFQAGAVAVDSLAARGYGLYHMRGNVWEWTADWFAPFNVNEKSVSDPKGPASGVRKVVRGGGWYQAAYYVHAGRRFALDPALHLNALGFRCAWEVKE